MRKKLPSSTGESTGFLVAIHSSGFNFQLKKGPRNQVLSPKKPGKIIQPQRSSVAATFNPDIGQNRVSLFHGFMIHIPEIKLGSKIPIYIYNI